ncbi:hypothetical protein [Nocardioides sp.]|uniref:hypothetical protein n=1 Tax=Nocardioides sp. TaxID=35761 RepID=UPI003783CF78
MSETHEPGAAVFDPNAVVSLTGDAGDAAFASVFVDKFRALLPHRVRRIATTLGEGDVDEALDAVLSLRVSACLIGAGELCLLGRTLEAHLRRLDLPRARIAAVSLGSAADRADAALGDFLAA